MANDNGGKSFRRVLIAMTSIVATIILAMSGWSFTVLKTQAERDAERVEKKLDKIENQLSQLIINQNTNSNELQYLKNDFTAYKAYCAEQLKSLDKRLEKHVDDTARNR